MESGIYNIFFIFVPFELGFQPTLLRPFCGKIHPAFQGIVILFQNIRAVVCLRQCIRYNADGIRPSGRSVRHLFKGSRHFVLRCHTGDFSIRKLFQPHLVQPFAQYRIAVHQIDSRFHERSRIPGPALSFSGRAVCGNIRKISFHGPDGVAHQLIHIRITTGEESGLLHIRIYGMCGKVNLLYGNIALHQHVLESEDGKLRTINIMSLMAYIVDLLIDHFLRRHTFMLEIGDREISPLIQCLSMHQPDLLSRFRICFKGYISCHILSEVDDFFSRRSYKQFSLKTLMFSNGNIITAHQRVISEVFRSDFVISFCWKPSVSHRGIHAFAEVQSVGTDCPFIRSFPVLIRKTDNPAVHLQLRQE